MGAGQRVRILSLYASAAVATIGARAFAGNGFVTNSSFETPVTTGFIDDSNAQINNPSNATFWGWGYFFANTAVDHDAGVQNNTNSMVTADPDPNGGVQDGWVNGAGNYLYQDLGPLSANTTYAVTVGVAAPGGTAYGGVGGGNAPTTDEVDLLNGTNTVSGTTNNVATNGTLLNGSGVIAPPAGSFQDVTVSFTTPATVTGDLIVQLMEDTAGAHEQGIFDDVQYTINGQAPAPVPQWVPNGSGDWNVATNWSTGSAPNAVGAEADFLGAITTAHTVFSDVPVTVGTIKFNNANTYVLAGAGSLTLQATGTNTAQVDVEGGGTDKITLPLTIASNTTFNAGSGSTLVISAPMTIDSGDKLSQTGTGTVSYQSTVTVQTGGTFLIANSSYAHSLTLQGTASTKVGSHTGSVPNILQLDSLSLGATSQLDVTNNAMIVHNGNLSQITSSVAAGYNSGHWNGSAGIVSSAAATVAATSNPNTAIGVAENVGSTFEGQTVSSTDVLVKYTYYGDANLDGKVNAADYLAIDSAFNSGTLTGWQNGDFNYDGKVNGDDYTLIDNAFNTQGSVVIAAVPAAPAEQIASAAVPEPASLSVIGISAAGLLLRRRRINL
jgi:Dockerin type I domain/PEP-CTERM motif